ncbi:MAG TPA: hypothetical protein VNL14_16830 [Candidatus Acidoferrales bacterium]|nr:hypothetical protein [Candidatus Acidoferrales bacterium]
MAIHGGNINPDELTPADHGLSNFAGGPLPAEKFDDRPRFEFFLRFHTTSPR